MLAALSAFFSGKRARSDKRAGPCRGLASAEPKIPREDAHDVWERLTPQTRARFENSYREIQGAFRRWHAHESALGHLPDAWRPPAHLTPRDKLVYVARARLGTSNWISTDAERLGVGRADKLRSVMSRAEIRELQRDNYLLSSFNHAIAGDWCTFAVPADLWCTSPNAAIRSQWAPHVFRVNSPQNCYIFIVTSLYAAGLISKTHCANALRSRQRQHEALGWLVSRRVDTTQARPGDIVFVAFDGRPFHAGIVADNGDVIDLSGQGSGRIKRVPLAQILSEDGTKQDLSDGRTSFVRTVHVYCCRFEQVIAAARRHRT